MTKEKTNFAVSFAADLFNEGAVAVPALLLQYYARLGVSEIDLVVILHILNIRQREGDYFPSPERLGKHVSFDTYQVKTSLASLMEKKLLEVETFYNYKTARMESGYSLAGIFEKIAEIWILEKAQQSKAREEAEGLANAHPPESKLETDILYLHEVFEKEFGRFLSPFESTQIQEWYAQQKFSRELILEALRRSVLRGIFNFKYIDSVLRDWHKNNIRTVKEVEAYEERFTERKGKRGAQKVGSQDSQEHHKGKKEKFRGIYMS